MRFTSHFETEIHQQPNVIRELLQCREDVESLAREIEKINPKFILIAARGSSANAATYAQYVLGTHNGYPVFQSLPSLTTIYSAPLRLNDALVIGISQSGESTDVCAVVEHAKMQGADTLAITNNVESTLARIAGLVMPLGVGTELSVAATKTYTGQLFNIAMLSAALSRSEERWAELARIPDQLQESLDTPRLSREQVRSFADCKRTIVLARGYNLATAQEIALKIKETSSRDAEPFSIAGFQHGPIASVADHCAAIVVAAKGESLHFVRPMFASLEELDVNVLAISNCESVDPEANMVWRLPADVPEWLSPIVGTIPGQLLALELSRIQGFDPDNPRGLSKITRTF